MLAVPTDHSDLPSALSLLSAELELKRQRAFVLHRIDRLTSGIFSLQKPGLSAIGHPVIGDRKYNPAEELERRITRVALLAAHLQFIHPRSGDSVCVDCEPPPDFQALLKALGLPISMRR